MRPRTGHRLVPWQRRLLIACGALLLASGVAWLALHYTIGAGAGDLPHPGEAWSMRLHGAAAFAALFVAGALTASHLPTGWRLSGRPRWARQRGTGVMLCTAALLLAASGYALYYFSSEATRPALGWAHAIIGVAMAAVALAHGRRRHPAPPG